jgi:hypothetical protein
MLAYPNMYIHGELYNPEYITQLNRLVKLVSVARKEKDITEEILAQSEIMVQLHVYDGYGFELGGKYYGPEVPLKERRAALFELIRNYPYVYSVVYEECSSEEEMKTFADAYISAFKGEGVVVKDPQGTYQHKRSVQCLKYKKWEDAEFEVVELLEGSGNWAGRVKMAVCKLPVANGNLEEGVTFRSNVEGPQEHLRGLWNRRAEWNEKGKRVTVRFQEFSEYGVPLIPYTDLLERNYE